MVFLVKNGLVYYKHNITHIHLKFDWLTTYNYETIQTCINQNKIDIIFAVHHETSTGIVNDINKLNTICILNHLELYLDCVSSAFYEQINVSELGSLSAITFSSNKCLMSYPGLSIIFAKESVLNKLTDCSLSYLNLKHYYDFHKKSQTPFTPQVSLFFSYLKAVSNLIENRINYGSLRNQLVNKLADFDITCLNTADFCDWLMIFKYDNPLWLIKNLEKRNIIIYGGKGQLSSNTFQISILNKHESDIDFLVKNIIELIK